MADYYPALARAVLKLENNNVQARQELYERARAVIVAELSKQNSKITDPVIVREQAALETAICRIEREALSDQAKQAENNGHREVNAADELNGMLKSLGAMLFSITFVVGLLAFSGVIYVRGLELVDGGVIGYPMLDGAMAILLCLFIPLSWAILRKTWG
jgi:hypothetical protein